MAGKLSITVVGLLIILFGVFGLLSMSKKPELSQGKAALIGISYTLVLLSGLGVIARRDWARVMIVTISVLGLALQVYEVSLAPEIKDVTEALLFIFFVLFFRSGHVRVQLK